MEYLTTIPRCLHVEKILFTEEIASVTWDDVLMSTYYPVSSILRSRFGVISTIPCLVLVMICPCLAFLSTNNLFD